MKALGIILVVLNHGRLLPDFHDHLWMRIYTTPRMPMFFFIAGMFLPVRKTAENPLYIIRHIGRHLVLPWLAFSIAGLFVLLAVCGVKPSYWPATLIFDANVPLWFLRTLGFAMFIEIWPAIFCKTRLQRMAVFILLAILSLAAFPISDHIHTLSWTKWLVVNTLAASEVCALAVYMWAGYILVCELVASKLTLSRKTAAIVFVASSAAMLLLNAGAISYRFVEYEGSPIAIWLTSWTGIATFWSAACMLRGCKPLALIGSCSLIILCVHYLPLILADRLWNIPRTEVSWISLVVSAISVIAVVKYRQWKSNHRQF